MHSAYGVFGAACVSTHLAFDPEGGQFRVIRFSRGGGGKGCSFLYRLVLCILRILDIFQVT